MATINATLAAQSDVGYEFEGGGTTDTAYTTALAIGTGTAATSPDRHVGFRFQLTGPVSGDTINSANFTLAKSGAEWKTWQVTFFLEAADNSGALSGTTLSGRTKTTASVNNNTNVNHTDGSTFTVNLAAALQEVINRAGWASGNYVTVICAGDGASNFANKTWHNYSTGTSAQRPKLDVDYTAAAGAGASPPPRRPPMHLLAR